MTIRRAALYIVGASLLAAWIASAASLSLQRGGREGTLPRAAAAAAEVPIIDVESQVRRLRERTSAPLPDRPDRNPFMFRPVAPERPSPAARRVQAAAVAEPAPAPPEPALALIGIAEGRRDGAQVRTAMLAAPGDELVMAIAGDVVLGRYTVSAVSQDAVELTDRLTGFVRRLVLQ